jgi:hypothetical protein
MEMTSMRGLWAAVLLRAVKDALGCDCEAHEREAARLWFHHGADFADVCELAGVNPFTVRRLMLAHLDDNMGSGRRTVAAIVALVAGEQALDRRTRGRRRAARLAPGPATRQAAE